MKKSIIAAGAASAVLAAMPVVGVFAEGATSGASSYVDNFQLRIAPVCTFERAATNNGHAQDGVGEETTPGDTSTTARQWTIGTDSDLTDTIGRADTMNLGDVLTGKTYFMGSSEFLIKCNTSGGYSVSMNAEDLVSTTNASDKITFSGNAIVSNAASTWNVSTAQTPTTENLLANGIVKHKETPTATAGEALNVFYNVGIVDNQAAGTYSGRVTYTLAQPSEYVAQP